MTIEKKDREPMHLRMLRNEQIEVRVGSCVVKTSGNQLARDTSARVQAYDYTSKEIRAELEQFRKTWRGMSAMERLRELTLGALKHLQFRETQRLAAAEKYVAEGEDDSGEFDLACERYRDALEEHDAYVDLVILLDTEWETTLDWVRRQCGIGRCRHCGGGVDDVTKELMHRLGCAMLNRRRA